MLSLQGHGFFLSNQSGLLCTDGELYVQMKDDVVYDLKFGGLAAGARSADDNNEGGTESTPAGADRYIFVLARFDEEAVPKPELTPLPMDVQPATISGALDDPKEAERRRIERENKHKMDEYSEKIEKAKKRVEELNSRFSDWYYVISDDVYQKIHLGRDEIVRQNKSETSVDAFEDLRKQGIEFLLRTG